MSESYLDDPDGTVEFQIGDPVWFSPEPGDRRQGTIWSWVTKDDQPAAIIADSCDRKHAIRVDSLEPRPITRE